ncbi:MAG: transketolase [Candidatus Promineifilaceae bacterium]|jgi:transketolase
MTDYDYEKHQAAANTIRGLAMDAVQKAKSGHPGMPMGMADVATVLWTRYLKHDPNHPEWPDRDRFILSAGHGSMLLYSLLFLSGYEGMTLEELQNFRQWDSKTPGHPEYGHTIGVEMTTGPLGQGISSAVGMALAEHMLAERYNRPDFDIVDHYTYVIASDGDLMEGISHEACSLAGHLGLGKLIVFYDDNSISIDGSTQISFTEDVLKRFDAYGWHTELIDGHDPTAVIAATEIAQSVSDRPSIIACRTKIGFGSPHKEGTSSAHGEPLGEEEVLLTKKALGLPLDEKFYVADGVKASFSRDGSQFAAWHKLWEKYAEAHPKGAMAYQDALAGRLPANLEELLPKFMVGKAAGTRVFSGQVIAALAPHIPSLIGGSADLTGSNKTNIPDTTDVQKDDFNGRYIRFGVREHGMGAILNGLSLHGGFRPFGGTFLVFSDYMRGSIRLAAIMGLPVIYVFTHDSIGVGEDGPTHQPIEQTTSLRLIPNMTVIRPGDGTETAYAWQAALENKSGPTALILSRQGVPTLEESNSNAMRGAYILRECLHDSEDPQVLLIGTGTELQIALQAQELLADRGVSARVISMPSWELFDQQPIEYQDTVLPPHLPARVSIEAGVTCGWKKYVGDQGVAIGLDRFGASAPYARVYEELGLTAEAVAIAAEALLVED